MDKSRLKPNDLFFLERQQLADQIRGSRFKDRGGNLDRKDSVYETNRDAVDYILDLGGLQELFKHVKKIGTPNVLDVGAGTTAGVNGLAKSEFGKEINFYATVLTNDERINENLGLDRTAITSIESFRAGKIPKEGYGAVISDQAITYTDKAELAVKSLKKLLVTKGVFKAVVPYDVIPQFRTPKDRKVTSKNPEYFLEVLKNHNFDTYLGVHTKEGYRFAVLVAVKDGERFEAKSLFEEDIKSVYEQARSLVTGQEAIDYINFLQKNEQK